jgi:hypothetical protein
MEILFIFYGQGSKRRQQETLAEILGIWAAFVSSSGEVFVCLLTRQYVMPLRVELRYSARGNEAQR